MLSFINKQSSSVLPVPLQLKAELIHTNAMDVVINLPSGAYLDVVNPLVSCLDIDWKVVFNTTLILIIYNNLYFYM